MEKEKITTGSCGELERKCYYILKKKNSWHSCYSRLYWGQTTMSYTTTKIVVIGVGGNGCKSQRLARTFAGTVICGLGCHFPHGLTVHDMKVY